MENDAAALVPAATSRVSHVPLHLLAHQDVPQHLLAHRAAPISSRVVMLLLS